LYENTFTSFTILDMLSTVIVTELKIFQEDFIIFTFSISCIMIQLPQHKPTNAHNSSE